MVCLCDRDCVQGAAVTSSRLMDNALDEHHTDDADAAAAADVHVRKRRLRFFRVLLDFNV